MAKNDPTKPAHRAAIKSLDARRTTNRAQAPTRTEEAMKTIVGGTADERAALQAEQDAANAVAAQREAALDTVVGTDSKTPLPQSPAEQKFEKLMEWVQEKFEQDKISPEQFTQIISATRPVRDNAQNPTPAKVP